MDVLDKIICADAIEGLKTLDSGSVDMCVTSPPYYGLRDYGVDGQIGIEKTPAEYIERLTEIFNEVKRVLKSDGTLWVNISDSYAGSGKGPMSIQVAGNGKNSKLYNKQNIYRSQNLGKYKAQRYDRDTVDACVFFKEKRLVFKVGYNLAQSQLFT